MITKSFLGQTKNQETTLKSETFRQKLDTRRKKAVILSKSIDFNITAQTQWIKHVCFIHWVCSV